MAKHQPPLDGDDVETTRRYKRKAFEDLLQHSRLYLTLDTRVTGVKIPSEHQGKSALTIIFGLDMPLPLADLAVDDNGIEVTLSFERSPHHCSIPWDAVWYLVPAGDKEGILFEHSLPEAVKKTMESQGGNIVPLDLDGYLENRCCKTKEAPNKPRLEVIDGDGETRTRSSLTTEEYCDDDNDEEEASRRPSLRLVKADDAE